MEVDMATIESATADVILTAGAAVDRQPAAARS
jgi:hypothetical protein